MEYLRGLRHVIPSLLALCPQQLFFDVVAPAIVDVAGIDATKVNIYAVDVQQITYLIAETFAVDKYRVSVKATLLATDATDIK